VTSEANIDIQIDDSAVDALISSLGSLEAALDKAASGFDKAEQEANELDRDLEKLDKQAEKTESSVAALGVAAAGIGAGIVAAGAAIELARVSVEAFAETNERAGARMEMLSGAAQNLLGSIGEVILGGDQFEQTFEALTQVMEQLQGFVEANSDALTGLARGGIILALRGFFALADGVLAVIQFYENLDENMGRLQASFLDLKADVLEFAQDAERAIREFVANSIEGFADLVDSFDDLIELVVDNPVARRFFGLEEGEVLRGPFTIAADALRSAANSVRTGGFDRFADNIEDARLSAEALREAADATTSETAQIRENLRGARDEAIRTVESIGELTVRPLEVEVRAAGGGAGGAGGGRGSTSAAEERENALQALIGTTAEGLEGARELYEQVITQLLGFQNQARERFKQPQDTMLVNILGAAQKDPGIQEFFDMLDQREAVIARAEDLEQRLAASMVDLQRQERESNLLREISRLSGGAPPPDWLEERTADIMERYGLSEEQFEAAELRLIRLQGQIRDAMGAESVDVVDSEMRGLAREELSRQLEQQVAIRRATVQEERELLREANEERAAITSAGFEAETALLQEFLQSNLELIENTARESSKIFREEAQMQQAVDDMFAGAVGQIHQYYSQALNETAANFQTVLGYAEALGAGEEHINRIIERREAALARINREYRLQVQIQEELNAELKRPEFQDRDFSGMLTSGLGRSMGGDLRAMLRVDPIIDSIEELKAAYDELPFRLKEFARENDLTFDQVVKRVSEANQALRDVFKKEGINALTSSFEAFGVAIGNAIGGGFEDGLSAGDKAKIVLLELLGSILTSLGSAAIAQGTIFAFADPTTGGFPNPGRAAGLIAAGTAAIAVGTAFSAKAGDIRASAAGGDTTTGPAATPGQRGGGDAITNIIVENRFGSRFDAREMDRAAATSFERAAAAGQA